MTPSFLSRFLFFLVNDPSEISLETVVPRLSPLKHLLVLVLHETIRNRTDHPVPLAYVAGKLQKDCSVLFHHCRDSGRYPDVMAYQYTEHIHTTCGACYSRHPFRRQKTQVPTCLCVEHMPEKAYNTSHYNSDGDRCRGTPSSWDSEYIPVGGTRHHESCGTRPQR